MATTYKILTNILLSSLTPYAEEIIGDDQCGFQHSRSTTYHMEIVYVTNKMQLIMIFIDNNALYVSGVSCPSSGAQELCVQPMVLAC